MSGPDDDEEEDGAPKTPAPAEGEAHGAPPFDEDDAEGEAHADDAGEDEAAFEEDVYEAEYIAADEEDLEPAPRNEFAPVDEDAPAVGEDEDSPLPEVAPGGANLFEAAAASLEATGAGADPLFDYLLTASLEDQVGELGEAPIETGAAAPPEDDEAPVPAAPAADEDTPGVEAEVAPVGAAPDEIDEGAADEAAADEGAAGPFEGEDDEIEVVGRGPPPDEDDDIEVAALGPPAEGDEVEIAAEALEDAAPLSEKEAPEATPAPEAEAPEAAPGTEAVAAQAAVGAEAEPELEAAPEPEAAPAPEAAAAEVEPAAPMVAEAAQAEEAAAAEPAAPAVEETAVEAAPVAAEEIPTPTPVEAPPAAVAAMAPAAAVAASAALETSDAPAPAPGRSLWDDARRRLFRNPAAVASLYVIAALALIAALGPLVWVHKVGEIFPDYVGAAPTLQNMHWLGADTEGRDMVARVLFGLRISLLVGLAATLVAITIGVAWGAVAGFIGGAVDEMMMRIVDVLYSVPFIFFVIVVMTVWRTDSPLANLMLIFVAIGAVEWLTMARIVRGQTIALRKKEFIEAARAAGARPLQIVARHIVPNVLGPVVVFATLNIPVIILAESFLSFLGLGVQEPLTSLGKLISDGVKQMQAPWMLIAPAVVMVVTLLALNFLGDGLRDALDPKER